MTDVVQEESRQVDNLGQLRYKIANLPTFSAAKFPKAYNALKKEVLGSNRISVGEADSLYRAVQRYLSRDLLGKGGTRTEADKISQLSLEGVQRLWNYYTTTVPDAEMEDVILAIRDGFEARSMERESQGREPDNPKSPSPAIQEEDRFRVVENRLAESLEKFAAKMDERMNSLATTVQRLTMVVTEKEPANFFEEDEGEEPKGEQPRLSTHSLADLRKEVGQMAKAEGKTRVFDIQDESGIELDEDQLLTVELWLGLDAGRLWQSLKTYFTSVNFKFKEPDSSSRRFGQRIRDELDSKVGLQVIIPRLLKEYSMNGLNELCRNHLRDANLIIEKLMYYRDGAQYGEWAAKKVSLKAASMKVDRTTFLKARSAVLSEQVFHSGPPRTPGGKRGPARGGRNGEEQE
jgi:hypothetical protein